MREIEFRGKKYNGKWVYGFFTLLNDVPKIINENGVFDVLRDTVGQYTGLKDYQNCKIFEDDIMNVNGEYGIVKYNGIYSQVGGKNIPALSNFLVVGNIHDNPELMKGE